MGYPNPFTYSRYWLFLKSSVVRFPHVRKVTAWQLEMRIIFTRNGAKKDYIKTKMNRFSLLAYRTDLLWHSRCAMLISSSYLYSWLHRRYNPLGKSSKMNRLYWYRYHQHDNYVYRPCIHRYLRKGKWISFTWSRVMNLGTNLSTPPSSLRTEINGVKVKCSIRKKELMEQNIHMTQCW